MIISDICPDPEGEGSCCSIISMLPWYNYFIHTIATVRSLMCLVVIILCLSVSMSSPVTLLSLILIKFCSYDSILSEGTQFPSGVSDKALAVASLVVLGIISTALTVVAIFWRIATQNELETEGRRVSLHKPSMSDKSYPEDYRPALRLEYANSLLPNTVNVAVNTSHSPEIVPIQTEMAGMPTKKGQMFMD